MNVTMKKDDNAVVISSEGSIGIISSELDDSDMGATESLVLTTAIATRLANDPLFSDMMLEWFDNYNLKCEKDNADDIVWN